MEFAKNLQSTIWTSPEGQTFVLKTLESGYKRKHIGEVKENPRTSVSSSSSTKAGGGKKSSTSSHTSVSTSRATKRVQDSNDTFTDMGIGGRDSRLDCYFIGEKHAQESEAFENALCQVGKSQLQLPYRDEFTVNVLDFDVKNNFIQNVNCTIVSVQFHETSKTTYPKSDKSKTKEIKNAASNTKAAIAQNLSATVSAIQNPTRLQSFTNSFSAALGKVSKVLDTANNVSLNSVMSDIMGQSVGSNILTMASQLGIVFYKAANLTKKVKNAGSSFSLPGTFRTLSGGWSDLISTLIQNSATSSRSKTITKDEIDNLLINDSIASLAIISAAENLIEEQFDTRAEAVEAAKTLEILEETWTSFVEAECEKITSLEDVFIRDGGTTNIVSAAANEILERSYKLKVEKRITLSEDMSIIDLAYTHYPESFRDDPDGTINYLITTNGFADDEFFLLKRGREVKIYV